MAGAVFVEFTDEEALNFPYDVPYEDEAAYLTDLKSVKSGRRMYACTRRYFTAKDSRDSVLTEQHKQTLRGLFKDFTVMNLRELTLLRESQIDQVVNNVKEKINELTLQKSAYVRRTAAAQDRADNREALKTRRLLELSTSTCCNDTPGHECSNLAVGQDATGEVDTRLMCTICRALDNAYWEMHDTEVGYGPLFVYCSDECMQPNLHHHQLSPRKEGGHACSADAECTIIGDRSLITAESPELGWFCSICMSRGRVTYFCNEACMKASIHHRDSQTIYHARQRMESVLSMDTTGPRPQLNSTSINEAQEWVKTWMEPGQEYDQTMERFEALRRGEPDPYPPMNPLDEEDNEDVDMTG